MGAFRLLDTRAVLILVVRLGGCPFGDGSVQQVGRHWSLPPGSRGYYEVFGPQQFLLGNLGGFFGGFQNAQSHDPPRKTLVGAIPTDHDTIVSSEATGVFRSNASLS